MSQSTIKYVLPFQVIISDNIKAPTFGISNYLTEAEFKALPAEYKKYYIAVK